MSDKEWREASDVQQVAIMIDHLIDALPTRREYLTAAALTGYCATGAGNPREAAEAAVMAADHALRELSKEPPE